MKGIRGGVTSDNFDDTIHGKCASCGKDYSFPTKLFAAADFDVCEGEPIEGCPEEYKNALIQLKYPCQHCGEYPLMEVVEGVYVSLKKEGTPTLIEGPVGFVAHPNRNEGM